MGAIVSRSLVLLALVLGLSACDAAIAPTTAAIGDPPATSAEPSTAAATPRVKAAAPPPSRPVATPKVDRQVLASAVAPDAPYAPDIGAAPRPVLAHAEPVDSVVREVFFGDRDEQVVALTFDDGPSRENTPRILEVLDREDVRATFFVLGDRAKKMPDLVAAIDEGGHDVGNHTWSHGSLRSMWASQIRDELRRTNDAVFDAIGRRPALFRPPFGRYAPSALPIVGELGMHVVLWSVDGEDWESETETTATRVVRDASAGDIILLHDRTATTAAALPSIIRGLRARGFRLVTVSELTGLRAYAPATRASASPVP